jgi:GH24 family phage-related lysozyme (muramidase)
MERQSPTSLTSSRRLLELIDESEGNVLYAYDDADKKATKTQIKPGMRVVGTLTIARGHTGRDVYPGQTCTEAESLAWFKEDVAEAEDWTRRTVKVPLFQHEFDAVTDLYYNVGPGHMPGSNGDKDLGKDGILCLGKNGGGRQSTLLSTLNSGDYATAAGCFTQWRMPGSIWEWGLTKRRIRGKLLFLGLSWKRAQNAFPNTMPLGDIALAGFVARCLRLAREEQEDLDGLAPPAPKPSPAATPAPKDELVLDEPIKLPTEARPKEIPASAAREPAAAEAPTSGPLPQVVPLPKPPKPPVIIAPKSVDVHSIPYGQVDPANGAKNMSDSRRVLGMVIVGVGSVVQIVSLRLGVGTAVGAVFFDLTRDPVVIALVTTGIIGLGAVITRKRGTRIVTKGMIEAKELLK